MANATEAPAAAAPVDEKKVEKEVEKEPETTTPEETEPKLEKNGNGHTKEDNGDAEEGNGDTEEAEDKEEEDAVEEKEDNPLKRKSIDVEDDCLKKQKVIEEEKEAEAPRAEA